MAHLQQETSQMMKPTGIEHAAHVQEIYIRDVRPPRPPGVNNFGQKRWRWRPQGDSNPCYRRERAVS
jgi:hypothetical protein